jgi:hypothetical protein
VARAVQIADDEIEEYDDELIEILDDEGEAAPAPSPPELVPLELSPSRPQVEMRRREQPLSERPEPAAAPVASRGLSVERVERAPLPDAVVVATSGTRAQAKLLPFVELLDASLKLGR